MNYERLKELNFFSEYLKIDLWFVIKYTDGILEGKNENSLEGLKKGWEAQ